MHAHAKQNKIDYQQSSKLFTIKSIPFKGYGLIASNHINKYTLILSEKPLMKYSNHDAMNKQVLYNKLMELPQSQQETINKMACSIIYDDCKMNEDKLCDIIDRNNIEIINDNMNGLFPSIAGINHSCVPNVVWFGINKHSHKRL